MAPRRSVDPNEDRSTRDLILDAAERRFAEHGYSGVAVREIAADAGLKNQASLYHHFKNKRAIYEAVLARGIQPLVERIAQGMEKRAEMNGGLRFDAETTAELLDAVFDYLLEQPYLPRLIQRAGLDDGRYLRKALPKLLRPLYEQGLLLLSNVQAHWQADELPHLAAGFYHLIFGYFANASMLEAVLQQNLKSPKLVARQREFLHEAAFRLLGTQS